MKRVLLLAALLLAAAGPTTASTCTGKDPCTACKTCDYCKHCNEGHGLCGVCKRDAAHLANARRPKPGPKPATGPKLKH